MVLAVHYILGCYKKHRDRGEPHFTALDVADFRDIPDGVL